MSKTFSRNCYLVKIDSNNVIIIMSQFPITNITNETFSKFMYHDRNKTRSNLPFQIALYVNLWFFPIWLLISIVNLDAKYNNLSNVYKLLAVAIFLVLSIFESLKLYLGYLGNLTGKIPELTSCWLISILIQLPLEAFLLFDRGILSHYSETLINFFMVCLLLIEIITGMIALMNLADYRAKVFYLMHLYDTCT